MKLGYARVSTTDQDRAIQRRRLHEAGCEKLFEEKASGARKKRPEIERLLGFNPLPSPGPIRRRRPDASCSPSSRVSRSSSAH